MLAGLGSLVAGLLFFAQGFWLAGRFFGLDRQWRWVLAYPLGLSLSGMCLYFLWLLGLSWNVLIIFFVACGVVMSKPLFQELRTVGWSPRAAWDKLLLWISSLRPLETLFLAISGFSGFITVAWHLFVRPVVWDSLVLYDFRAQQIANGWKLENFFAQFHFIERFAAYDFSHGFLPSIWQAVSHSLYAPISTALYLGLLVSVLAHAWLVIKSRPAWLSFTTLLLATPLFLTVWTRNYGTEPYVLLWIHLFLLIFSSDRQRPRTWLPLTLIFFLAAMLCRVSEPFWLVFLLWYSVNIWRVALPIHRKVLWLTLAWLPALALFAHWWQLQQEAQTWVQIPTTASVSSYDPRRYQAILGTLRNPELWLRWLQISFLQNVVMPHVLSTILLIGVTRKRKSQDWILFLLFNAMMGMAMLLEMAADWPAWQGKASLLWRVGLPIAALSLVITAQRIELWLKSQTKRKNLRTKLEE